MWVYELARLEQRREPRRIPRRLSVRSGELLVAPCRQVVLRVGHALDDEGTSLDRAEVGWGHVGEPISPGAALPAHDDIVHGQVAALPNRHPAETRAQPHPGRVMEAAAQRAPDISDAPRHRIASSRPPARLARDPAGRRAGGRATSLGAASVSADRVSDEASYLAIASRRRDRVGRRIMSRSTLAVGVFIVLAASFLLTGTASARARPCGVIHVRGEVPRHPFHARIDRGRVSCGTARHVLRGLFDGRARRHGGPANYQTYYTLYGWRCSFGAGAAFCSRSRDEISAVS